MEEEWRPSPEDILKVRAEKIRCIEEFRAKEKPFTTGPSRIIKQKDLFREMYAYMDKDIKALMEKIELYEKKNKK